MIKNPGGGLAKIGGYVAGKAWAVEKIAQRITVPGVGRESGASLNTLQDFYQGLFLAPHTVLQAKKTAIFAVFVVVHNLFIIKKRSYLSLRDKYEQLVHFLFINCLQMDFRKAIDI
jgi:cystathionine beta-lyase family protein involved in aluminum resistance